MNVDIHSTGGSMHTYTPPRLKTTLRSALRSTLIMFSCLLIGQIVTEPENLNLDNSLSEIFI